MPATALVPTIDAQYGVYVRGKDGDWHFNVARFEDYLARAGIDWPRDEASGKLNLRRKTFDSMAKAWPELEALRQLRHARDKMRRIKLAVGSDGRNRTVLWPFASKTSRTQPKAAQWIFSPSIWLRSLIKPAPGRAIAYIDWSSMEFQIAAALSECRPMLELYASGSPYISFAKRFDEAPPEATKKIARPRARTLQGRLPRRAIRHADRDAGAAAGPVHVRGQRNARPAPRAVQSVLAMGRKTGPRARSTPASCPRLSAGRCRTGITEFNARSIGNWPVQSTGADILRLACVWAIAAAFSYADPFTTRL